MVRDGRALTVSSVFSAGLTICLYQAALFHFERPYPAIGTALSSPVANLRDFSGLLLGFRRLAADIAWTQTLQYYGTHEVDYNEDAERNGTGHYPDFLALCERVGRMDPHFTYVYYYGGGVLGWNLNRLDEAEALLRLGIENNPKEWRLTQYLAAMAYQRDHRPERLVTFLESFVSQPDCPNLLRALLANVYKKQRRYRDSIRVWLKVLDTSDPLYTSRAQDQIKTMAPLAKLGAARSS